MPIAGGEIGAMVWGDGHPLILTLDRYDVWDLRSWKPDSLRYHFERWRKLIEEGRASEIREEFETKHWAERDRGEVPSPTRLPLGRLEIELPAGSRIVSGKLDIAGAESRWAGELAPAKGGGAALPGTRPPPGPASEGRPASGVEPAAGAQPGAFAVKVLAHATRPILAVEISGLGPGDVSWTLEPAKLSEGEERRLERLGYKPPTVRSEPGDGWVEMSWTFNGDREVVTSAKALKLAEGRLLLALSIQTAPAAERSRPGRPSKDAESRAAGAARAEVAAFLSGGEGGWAARAREHRQWWERFWSASSLELPDKKLEAAWFREMYKLGSLSRPGKFPISLQGLWTKDGGLPPWAGDYHLDMNVQETYWPVYASNHLELGLPLYEQFFKNLPRYRRMCGDFFGFDGCYTRCEQGIDGSEIFGYATTNSWAGNGAWLAHHFWLHWRYSLDFEFLSSRAFPFLRSCMDLYLGLLEKGEDGTYHIPVTNSPEFHENGDSAWGKDDSGNLFLIQFLAQALLEADRVLGKNDPDRERWRDVLAHLAPLPGAGRDPATGAVSYRPNGRGGIFVMAQRPYDMPHRHMTHLLGIYPLCLLRKGSSPDVDLLIDDSLDNVIEQAKPVGDWAGWTFPWVSLLAAHAGRASLAVDMLHKYVDAHTYPNSLHENGDWKGLGTTRLHFAEPTVTLEAGFAAAAAVMDLLLQSDGGVIRLFPAVPREWHDARFWRLRAEGAFVVSARRQGGDLVEVVLESEKGGPCRLSGLPGRPAVTDGAGAAVSVDFEGGIASFATTPGTRYLLGFSPQGRP
jgi:alpha-L-fucosidase 2